MLVARSANTNCLCPKTKHADNEDMRSRTELDRHGFSRQKPRRDKSPIQPNPEGRDNFGG